jgi:hypothetical protein
MGLVERGLVQGLGRIPTRMVVDSSRLAGNKLYHDVEGQDAGREKVER